MNLLLKFWPFSQIWDHTGVKLFFRFLARFTNLRPTRSEFMSSFLAIQETGDRSELIVRFLAFFTNLRADRRKLIGRVWEQEGVNSLLNFWLFSRI